MLPVTALLVLAYERPNLPGIEIAQGRATIGRSVPLLAQGDVEPGQPFCDQIRPAECSPLFAPKLVRGVLDLHLEAEALTENVGIEQLRMSADAAKCP